MPLLEVADLRKSYGTHRAVDGLTFSIEAGEVVGLLGPNGSGKTTTMLMLAGLLPPDSGSIRLNGRPFHPQDRDLRRLLGIVPQELALYPDLTTVENLNFFGRLYRITGEPLRKRIATILEQIGLTGQAHARAGTFSGGMKRRLNFGIALLHSPRLLILDEPTVGVDPQSRSHLLDCVRQLGNAGVAVLYASHYMEEVESLCDRVAIIDHGRMLAWDRVQDLLGRQSSDICLRIAGGKLEASQLPGPARLEPAEKGGTIVLPAESEDGSFDERLVQVLQLLKQRGAEVTSIETREASLERLFLELTGRTLRD